MAAEEAAEEVADVTAAEAGAALAAAVVKVDVGMPLLAYSPATVAAEKTADLTAAEDAAALVVVVVAGAAKTRDVQSAMLRTLAAAPSDLRSALAFCACAADRVRQ